jgi:D-alanine-D-alanine ligase
MSLVAVLYNDDATLCRGAEVDRRAIAAVEGACDAVAGTLRRAGFAVQKVPTGRSAAALAAHLDALRPAVVFNMGESFAGSTAMEPHLAAMLELLGIPYTGSSLLTLALARDKALAQRLLEAYGLPVVKSVAVGYGDGIGNGMDEGGLEGLAEGAVSGLTPPLFVKPCFEDASHGITSENFCANAAEALRRAAALSREFQQPCLIQEFLPGREFLAGVILDGQLLPLSEIDWQLPEGWPRILTGESKWMEESLYFRGTPVKCPAEVEDPLAGQLRDLARRAYQALECRDYARVDIRLDGQGAPHILEVNPNPDLSPEAGLARAAIRGGISYDELIIGIVRQALARGTLARGADDPAA